MNEGSKVILLSAHATVIKDSEQVDATFDFHMRNGWCRRVSRGGNLQIFDEPFGGIRLTVRNGIQYDHCVESVAVHV
jgi:hypothetical protein